MIVSNNFVKEFRLSLLVRFVIPDAISITHVNYLLE